MNHLPGILFAILICAPAMAGETKVVKDLPYYGAEATAAGDAAMKERCIIDLHLPVPAPSGTGTSSGFPTLVWFHGGSLSGGWRYAPDGLAPRGIAVAAVGYRLSPTVTCPTYIQDAAAATAWVLDHIKEYGGDPTKVFIGGHSAGGYLTAMVGMDPSYLARHGHKPMDLAGLIPVSGQMTTHFTVRGERKQSDDIPMIDQFAPIAHVTESFPPMILITGEEKLELPSRVLENRWFTSVLRDAGHDRVVHHELDGLNHGTCIEGGMPLIRDFITGIAQEQPGKPRRFVAIAPAGQPARTFAFGEDGDWRSTGITRGGTADLDANLTLSWKDDGLQVAVDVTDDIHQPPKTIAAGWQSDSVQIAFQSSGRDGTNRFTELVLAEVDGSPALFCYGAQEKPPVDAPATLPKAWRKLEGATAEVLHKGNAIHYALTIPPAWLGQQRFASGDGLALSVLVNDNDGKGRKGYLHWGDGIGATKNPKQYNIVTLDR